MIVLTGLMYGFLGGTALGGTAAALYGGAVGVRILAANDIFWTYVNEGTAKAFLRNGTFQKLEMSLKEHCFVCQLVTDTITDIDEYVAKRLPGLSTSPGKRLKQAKLLNHPWLIIKPNPEHLPPPDESRLASIFDGIKGVGIYPFSQVHTHKFRWSRVKQVSAKEVGKAPTDVSMEKQLTLVVQTSEELLDYILITDYTYAGVVRAAETKGGIPVDILFILTIQVENPYKALFGTFDWLRVIFDQIGTQIRDYIGDYSYEQAINKDLDAKKLLRKLSADLARIRQEYGAYIKLVQVQGVEPASELATTFRDATTRLEIAGIDAKVVEVAAAAEKKRIGAVYEAIGKHEHGPGIRAAEAIEKSKLTTLVTGSPVLPSINVGGKSPEPTDKA